MFLLKTHFGTGYQSETETLKLVTENKRVAHLQCRHSMNACLQIIAT